MHIMRKGDGGYEVLPPARTTELSMEEKQLQNIVAKNLPRLFGGLRLLQCEFRVGGQRLDTVAFNDDNSSFVIIEYKKKKHTGLLEQGMSYHALLHNNNDVFYDLYKANTDGALDKTGVNFDDIRLILISPGFTDHQMSGIESAPRGSELYEVSEYSDGTIALCRVCRDLLDKSSGAGAVLTEEQHLEGKGSADLYYKLKDRIIDELGLEAQATNSYVGFYSWSIGALICAVRPGPESLNLEYVTTDPKVLPKDDSVELIRHNKKYRSYVKSEADLDKAIRYIRLVLNSKGR